MSTCDCIAAYRTSARRSQNSSIKSLASISNISTNTARNELDSHADTCALGPNFIILHYTGRVCDVAPYNAQAYEPQRNIPIVTAATAYTDQETGEVFIIVINEALWFGESLTNSLLNPNQLRYAGIHVQDNPFDSAPLAIATEDVTIPLLTKGTNIYFETTAPSQQELDKYSHIHLTLDTEWDPHSVCLSAIRIAEAETNIGDHVEPGLLQISSVFSDSRMAELLPQARNIRTIDVETRKTFRSKERHPIISGEQLSERWAIGLGQAKQTINVTTQRGARSAILPLSRRYRTDRMYHQKKLRGPKFYTDTLFGRCKSVSNNTCAQIFANEHQFVKAYPIESKAMAGKALRQFIREFGVPERLTSDGASEQVGPNTDFMKNIRKYEIEHHVSEPGRPQQNRAESVIREVKRRWFRLMVKQKAPKRLWDYGIVWVCEVMSLTANSSFSLDGRTPMEEVTGETPDISEYLDFTFYDWVWYKDNAGVGDNMFGKWLGVSHRIGNLMSYWILTENGRVISRTTVQRVTNLELATAEVKERSKEYNNRVNDLLKEDNHIIQGNENEMQLQDWDGYTDDGEDEFANDHGQLVSDPEVPEADADFTPDTFGDRYLNKEIALAADEGQMRYGKVTKRLRDAEGRPIGTAADNPLLDTREYAVEFPDGREESLTANIIAQHLYSQIDEEGNKHLLLDDIIDYKRSGNAIDKRDAFVTMKNGVRRRKETTQGWSLLCQWKDGSSNWVALKDARLSYPVLVAEYAVANRLDDEPAFAWWVHDVLMNESYCVCVVSGYGQADKGFLRD